MVAVRLCAVCRKPATHITISHVPHQTWTRNGTFIEQQEQVQSYLCPEHVEFVLLEGDA